MLFISGRSDALGPLAATHAALLFPLFQVYQLARNFGWEKEECREKQLAANERAREDAERKAKREAEKAAKVERGN